ncbi:MAG: LysR family transcriptional regulator [Roseateles sp.]|uniref:LysR family transcriptional regulator n=1 Tax=Roseateles sp. TaxID=1971397 RepID=UPI0039EBD7B7
MSRLSQLPVDPQALRAFTTVAREGNVSRAAERLHLSQPAVSLQLKALAEATGLKLLRRTPQGMALTPDGAALLPLADKALAGLGEFASAAAALLTTVRGRLRIGTILDPEFTRLGAFLRQLVESSPQIDTQLRQDMSGEVLALIAGGQLDAGFFLDLPDEPVGAPWARRTLTRFSYRVLAPAGWGPQVRGKDWKALAALPWLGTPPSSVHHRLQRRVFGPGSASGLEPQRVALVDQESSMLDLVRSGVGLSLVRESIALHEAHSRGLVMADRVALDCELSFVCRAERRAEPVIAAALAALDAVWL